MRPRWILLPLGALVLIAAVGYYVVGLPPTLADDYENAEAEGEYLDRARAFRQIEREVARGNRRADKRSVADMDRLLKRSRYRELIDDLEQRETEITQMFEDL